MQSKGGFDIELISSTRSSICKCVQYSTVCIYCTIYAENIILYIQRARTLGSESNATSVLHRCVLICFAVYICTAFCDPSRTYSAVHSFDHPVPRNFQSKQHPHSPLKSMSILDSDKKTWTGALPIAFFEVEVLSERTVQYSYRICEVKRSSFHPIL